MCKERSVQHCPSRARRAGERATAAGAASLHSRAKPPFRVGAQVVQGLAGLPRATALALSPNALALAAVGTGAGAAGCCLRISLLPSSAGDACARSEGGEERDAACGSAYGNRRAPHAGVARLG